MVGGHPGVPTNGKKEFLVHVELPLEKEKLAMTGGCIQNYNISIQMYLHIKTATPGVCPVYIYILHDFVRTVVHFWHPVLFTEKGWLRFGPSTQGCLGVDMGRIS